MTSVGDSFAWPFQDQQFFGKILVQGLITLIPIVGWIATFGWFMMIIDNYRAGRRELPPAGFHLERGIAIFLAFLVYGIVLGIPAIILYAIGGATAAANNGNNAAAAAGSGLFSLAGLIGFVAGLFLRFLIPSLIVNTYHGGLAGAFDLEKVWRGATLNVTNSVLAGLIILVASFIGGIGFLCCIGFIFTIPYENTINAGAAAWFEKQQAAPAAPPAAPAT